MKSRKYYSASQNKLRELLYSADTQNRSLVKLNSEIQDGPVLLIIQDYQNQIKKMQKEIDQLKREREIIQISLEQKNNAIRDLKIENKKLKEQGVVYVQTNNFKFSNMNSLKFIETPFTPMNDQVVNKTPTNLELPLISEEMVQSTLLGKPRLSFNPQQNHSSKQQDSQGISQQMQSKLLNKKQQNNNQSQQNQNTNIRWKMLTSQIKDFPSLPIKSSEAQIDNNDQFKLQNIMSIVLEDETLISQYKADHNNKFIRQMVVNPDKLSSFLNIHEIGYIQEKLLKMAQEHYELFQYVIKLKQIIRSMHYIGQSLVIMDAMDSIASSVCQILNCDRATIYIVDSSKEELWSKVAKGTDKVIRFPLNQGIAGAVVQKKDIVNVVDAYKDDRFNKKFDQENNYKTKTILACPLIHANKVIGVIQCINKKEVHFNKNDEFILWIISDLCKNVLSHALYQDQQYNYLLRLKHSQITAVNLIQTSSIQQFCHYFILRIKLLLNTDFAQILLVKDQKLIKYNFENNTFSFCLQSGIAWQSYTDKQLISVKSAQSSILFNSLVDIPTNLPLITYPINDIGILQIATTRLAFQLNVPVLTEFDNDMLISMCKIVESCLKWNNHLKNSFNEIQ